LPINRFSVDNAGSIVLSSIRLTTKTEATEIAIARVTLLRPSRALLCPALTGAPAFKPGKQLARCAAALDGRHHTLICPRTPLVPAVRAELQIKVAAGATRGPVRDILSKNLAQ
jgi:hypothetical protein